MARTARNVALAAALAVWLVPSVADADMLGSLAEKFEAELSGGNYALALGLIFVAGLATALTRAAILEGGTEWVLARDMSVGRGFFASGVLRSGKVIVAGGLSQDAEATTATELYDPMTDTWSRAADLPDPLAWSASLVIDGELWIFGGAFEVRAADGPGFPREMTGSSRVLRYDEARDSWVEGTPLPEGRYAHAAALLPDGRVLVAGGLEFADLTEVGYAFDAFVTEEPL